MAIAVAWADLRARIAAANFVWNGKPVPCAFPNTTFAAPAGNLPWVRADLAGGSALPFELGALSWRDEGQSNIDIFVPVGSGLDATIALCDAVQAMFRAPPYTEVVYSRTMAEPGGTGDDNGQYFISTVRAEWYLQTQALGRS